MKDKLKKWAFLSILGVIATGLGVKNFYAWADDNGFNRATVKFEAEIAKLNQAALDSHGKNLVQRESLQTDLQMMSAELVKYKTIADQKSRVITHETIKYISDNPDRPECVLPDDGVQLIRHMVRAANSGRDPRARPASTP